MQPTLLKTQADVIATQPKLVRLPTVMRMTGLCRSTIYSLIAEHQFPVQVQLSKRAVAWRQNEIEAWSLARPAVPQARHASSCKPPLHQGARGADAEGPLEGVASHATGKRPASTHVAARRGGAQAS